MLGKWNEKMRLLDKHKLRVLRDRVNAVNAVNAVNGSEYYGF